MPLRSDIVLDASKFAPSAVDEGTKKLNGLLEHVTAAGPHWYEVGVAKYREMRETGETPLPVPVYLAEAKDATIPSREKGRDIPLRVYMPDNGEPSKGIFLHFHGGGFIMGSHKQ
jgi:acetyl esterase/lipase